VGEGEANRPCCGWSRVIRLLGLTLRVHCLLDGIGCLLLSFRVSTLLSGLGREGIPSVWVSVPLCQGVGRSRGLLLLLNQSAPSKCHNKKTKHLALNSDSTSTCLPLLSARSAVRWSDSLIFEARDRGAPLGYGVRLEALHSVFVIQSADDRKKYTTVGRIKSFVSFWWLC